MDKYTGKRLDGRYEIHELLGVGGMAMVYRAYDTIDDRMVAIKILKDEFLHNEEFCRRFRNESKAIAVLSHPNIVKVYDVSFGDRIQYIVMEYIDGITLREYLDQQTEVRWKEAIHFTVQILRALEHAHQKGIVHRDIKPQNIMLLQDGTIKVTDFGIARFAHNETRTMTDKAIGSVHYIAPEQARGDFTDERADVYSVGVMLYEMITGQLPFEADNAVSVAIMQLQSTPKPPHEINPDIPEGLEEITLKAMQKNVSQRYQSAAEMLRDIEEFRRNPDIVFEYKYFVDDKPTKYMDAIHTARGDTGSVSYNDNYEYVEEDMKGRRQRQKVRMIIGGVLLALILFLGYIGVSALIRSFTEPTEQVDDEIEVPNFVGMVYQTEILDEEEYKDFTFVLQPGNDPDQESGVVLRQTPNAGIMVKKGKEITLIINSAGEETEVPPVTGYEQSKASEVLTGKGLIPDIITVADEETAAGYVIRTDPASGEKVPSGTTVKVYVSSGPASQQVEVPSILGQAQSDAESMITAAGLVVGNISERDDSSQPAGTVLSSDPLPGIKVEKGTSVNLTVSSGKSSIKTVDVIVNLPNGVNQDIELKAYLDGTLYQSDTVNPSLNLNGLYTLSFEGTSGQKQLVIQLNGQEYAVFTLDFDTGKAQQTAQNPFEPPSESSEESTPESSEPSEESSETSDDESEEPGMDESSTGVTTD